MLLKTIIGLIRPIRGRVLFDGHDLARISDRELSNQRTRFGFVFQHAALFDSLTVGENVAFPLLEHTHYGQGQIREVVMDRLAEVGLPDNVVNKKPAELSGGMRKRVGLARALAMDPEILLYDEPTTGLDPIMSDVINELMIRTSRREEVTSVIVTHDMNSAIKVADRIVMAYPLARLEGDEPQLIFDGTPSEIQRTQRPTRAAICRRKSGRTIDGNERKETRDERRIAVGSKELAVGRHERVGSWQSSVGRD